MSEVNELYQQLILEHNKSPRNFKKLENATHDADGYNPLCGDHYHVWLKLDGDTIADIGFQGSGCAISKSSASMMTSAVKGATIQEAKEMLEKYHSVIMTKIGDEIPEEKIESLGSLGALAGVREFPARIKCASLAWHTMNAALTQKEKSVSTEN
ncbi:MAG: SUF system NifU family Fe-S cluster assembly protein [Ignavibacteriales bacterium]|nr:SUF system NifU family Fe-S cluster assembly protein [Ignavibacteriales bacterium]